jgi:NAD(P)-dependent dehydrogenase (short-subunit alcohol dehydrogenase family)
LNEIIARYTGVFKHLGLGPRDVVAALDTNSERYIAAYYAAAKAALSKYSEVLRQEVKSLGIKVSVIEPGFFNTNHTRIAAASSISDYDETRKRAQSANKESFDKGGDPMEVAEVILKIIQSPSPRLRYTVGKEKRYLLLRKILPESVMESQTRKHWRLDV